MLESPLARHSLSQTATEPRRSCPAPPVEVPFPGKPHFYSMCGALIHLFSLFASSHLYRRRIRVLGRKREGIPTAIMMNCLKSPMQNSINIIAPELFVIHQTVVTNNKTCNLAFSIIQSCHKMPTRVKGRARWEALTRSKKSMQRGDQHKQASLRRCTAQ